MRISDWSSDVCSSDLWGIREHATAAAMNGIALHGGLIPYSGGFLIFSDYCRPSVCLAALMGIRVVHVWTHDSIGVGDDGPTHQPVEHLARSEEHTSELQSPMRNSSAVFCLKKNNTKYT